MNIGRKGSLFARGWVPHHGARGGRLRKIPRLRGKRHPTSHPQKVGAEKPSMVFQRSSKLRSARTSADLRDAQTPRGVCSGHPWPGVEHVNEQSFEAKCFKTLQFGITDFTPLHQLFRTATPFFMFNQKV